MTSQSSFIEALTSERPDLDRGERLGLYAFLVGRWRMDAVGYADDGRRFTARGEIHAQWVLAGRALQDVWILPARDEPPSDLPAPFRFYGSTLRVYDPALDAWHILWSDALRPLFRRQIGRARGADIVQEGDIDGGGKSRWSFTEITPSSFHWLGERSMDGGATWNLLTEYFARRT